MNDFLVILSQRLMYTWRQDFSSRLENSPRALFYRAFSDLSLSKYLDVIDIRKYRIALSRLRMSSPRLAVETGRWRKPASVTIGEKVSLACNPLEEEYSFIICPVYQTIRISKIQKYYWKNTSML